MFIVLEGIDGAGKTLQQKLLYKKLMNNYKIFLTKEPTKNKIGLFISRLIKKQEINVHAMELLFMADRAEHVKEIKSKLKQNNIIICDRYYFSTIAYGAALGIDKKWLERTNSIFLKPDLIFLLDIDPKIALHRIKKRGMHKQYFEKIKFLKKVREEYKNLLKKYKDIVIINSNGEIEEITEKMIAIITSKLNK